MDLSNAESWSCDDVGRWLDQEGFSQYINLLTKVHQIDGAALLSLTDNDLRKPPLQFSVLGHIKNLALKIEGLQLACNFKRSPWKAIGNVKDRTSIPKSKQKHFHHEMSDSDSMLESGDFSFSHMKSPMRNDCKFDQDSSDLPTELWKTVLSFVYVFSVFLVTAFIMVVVHDRVPEMDKYPPLPDLFLDNMPYVPWAFDVCEMVGLVLCVIWFTILLFHKHR